MRALVGMTAAMLALAAAAPAGAHLGLRYPASRYGDLVLKEGPCGQAGGTRSATVTTLEPGAEIEVVWDEYVDHPGHFRIAFDADGDDDFADPRCLSGCTTRTPEIETYADETVLLDGIPDTPQGGQGSARVTLPDIECERCTLQVIQVMYDKPPYVTPGNDIYYQCADLILQRATPTACAGDCDGDGRVPITELIDALGIALGDHPLSECAGADADGDQRVAVGDLVRAVASSLNGCPP